MTRDEFTLMTSDEFDLWVNIEALVAEPGDREEWWWSR